MGLGVLKNTYSFHGSGSLTFNKYLPGSVNTIPYQDRIDLHLNVSSPLREEKEKNMHQDLLLFRRMVNLPVSSMESGLWLRPLQGLKCLSSAKSLSILFIKARKAGQLNGQN